METTYLTSHEISLNNELMLEYFSEIKKNVFNWEGILNVVSYFYNKN